MLLMLFYGICDSTADPYCSRLQIGKTGTRFFGCCGFLILFHLQKLCFFNIWFMGLAPLIPVGSRLQIVKTGTQPFGCRGFLILFHLQKLCFWREIKLKNRFQLHWKRFYLLDVTAEGFKPPTLRAEIWCAIQLRHAAICLRKQVSH